MITWFQKIFQRRFRTAFIIVILACIVSFLFVDNISHVIGAFQQKNHKRPFFGIDLADSGAVAKIQKDAAISVFFQFGSKPPQNEQFHQLSLKRHALIYAAKKAGLPAPSEKEVEAHIKTLRYFRNGDGQFDSAKYTNFALSPQTNTGLDMRLGDFLRVIGDDMRVNQLQSLITGPGYVTPAEIQRILQQNETTWTLVSANLDCSKAARKIIPSDDQILSYFQSNQPKYTIPPKVRVNYIEFPALNHLPQVAVTEEEIRAYYDANPSRFPRPPATRGIPSPAQDHYSLVRPNAAALLRQQRAQTLAVEAAGKLALDMAKKDVRPDSSEFDALLASHKLNLRTLPAFSKNAPPDFFKKNGATVAKETFALGAEARYSNPIATSQGAIVLVWQESMQECPADFADVADKVKTDYINEAQDSQIRQLAQKVTSRLETELASGVPFPIAIAKASLAEGVGVATTNHAPFTLRQHDASRYGKTNEGYIDRDLIESIRSLSRGQISKISVAGKTAKFVYAQNVEYSDLTDANPEYKRIEDALSARYTRGKFDSFVNQLVKTELEKTNKK